MGWDGMGWDGFAVYPYLDTIYDEWGVFGDSPTYMF